MSTSSYKPSYRRDPYFDAHPVCRPDYSTNKPPIGKSRMLSPNEITAAQFLFSIRIRYWTIRVYNGKLSFLQGGDVAMTPRGHMYFPPKHFKNDYICEPNVSGNGIDYESWFIHELVHVGMQVTARGMFSWAVSYRYELDARKSIKDYGMEAQGDLIADYYMLKKYNSSSRLLDDKYRDRPVEELLPLYEAILLKNSHFPFVGW